MDWVESAEAIGEVDELLARVGLGHGRRKTLAGTWEGGERRGRIEAWGDKRTDRAKSRGGAGGGVGEVRMAAAWVQHAGGRGVVDLRRRLAESGIYEGG